MYLLIRWFISATALLAAAYLIPGIQVSGLYIALIVAIVLGLVNAVLRPVVIILTLPINILTLGLFTFVVNGLLFWFVSSFIQGFSVDGFVTAMAGAVLVSLFSWLGIIFCVNRRMSRTTTKYHKGNFKVAVVTLVVTILLVAAMFILATVLFSTVTGYSTQRLAHVYFANKPEQILHVSIAATPVERVLGLSGALTLKENQGMLFLMPTTDRHAFWMKDMHFPIDIIWLSEGFEVKEITHGLSPNSYPNIFQPKQPVRYVLEVPSGWASKNQISLGNTLLIGSL